MTGCANRIGGRSEHLRKVARSGPTELVPVSSYNLFCKSQLRIRKGSRPTPVISVGSAPTRAAYYTQSSEESPQSDSIPMSTQSNPAANFYGVATARFEYTPERCLQPELAIRA